MVSNNLREQLAQYGQDQLLRFADELDPQELASLEAQIGDIDLAAIQSYYQKTQEISIGEKVDDLLEPLEPEACGSVNLSTIEEKEEFRRTGLEKIANGEVAVLLLAGGQGTRLGVDYPKGMYNVGLPSRKCLYQLQGERISRIQTVASEMFEKRGIVPWYIMTSEATKEKTRQYFAKKHFFGLKESDVVFFEQSTLPCLTFDGKIILETKSKVAKAPDGNGGLYKALRKCKIIEDMQSRGIKYIHVYCVDNILIKMADPTFIGFCIHKDAQCGAKVVEKNSATEAVGVIGKVDGKYQTVEYSEITLKTAQMRAATGRLKYSAANICNHYFTFEFLQDIVSQHDEELVHHVAKKKIPHVTEDGRLVKPTKPNGMKMEKFVFDVFPFASRFCVWEVLREDEFSPLKNADGASDSTPTTCRHHLYNLHYRFIINNGGHFSDAAGSTLPEIPGCGDHVDMNNNEMIKENISPTPDESRMRSRKNGSSEARGNGVARSISSESASSSDEEIQKMIIVEISPLVTYEGEDLAREVEGKIFSSPLIIASAKESVNKSRIRKPSFIVD